VYINLDSTTCRLMFALSALGDYYDGIESFHYMMQRPEYVPMFRGMEIKLVPSGFPRRVELEGDWYHVINTICSNNGLNITCSRENFLEKYPGIKRYNKLLSKPCAPHVEKTLVQHLLLNGYEPTKIGVSKFSCICCSEYISKLNEGIDYDGVKKVNCFRYQFNKWEVSGRHGVIDRWALEENSKFSIAEGATKKALFELIQWFLKPFLVEVSVSGLALGDEMDGIIWHSTMNNYKSMIGRRHFVSLL
jgi:OTT_1508-like deaminase